MTSHAAGGNPVFARVVADHVAPVAGPGSGYKPLVGGTFAILSADTLHTLSRAAGENSVVALVAADYVACGGSTYMTCSDPINCDVGGYDIWSYTAQKVNGGVGGGRECRDGGCWGGGGV